MDTTTKRSEGSCGYVAYDGNVREHDDEEQSWAFLGFFGIFRGIFRFMGILGNSWGFVEIFLFFNIFKIFMVRIFRDFSGFVGDF